jgi:hypothetical protein
MSKKRNRLIVEREAAGNYLLISLVSFAATVIIVRWFLELTGYPQVGNSTLHIAHVLWGGLLLFVAVLVALIWDNPSFMNTAAVLSGIGMGLFIDEVGKFVTHSNDYFFPAAAPIIYGFFLVTVLIYIFVRRPDENDPHRAMIHALEKIQDAIYGELDEEEGAELQDELSFARKAERKEIAEMADQLYKYVAGGNVPFKNYDPSFSRRISGMLETWGRKIGRPWHRLLMVLGLIITAFGAVLTLGTLIWIAISPQATAQSFLADLSLEAQRNDVSDLSGHILRLGLQVAIGIVALLAIYYILRGNERRGTMLAAVSVALSLTAVQLITFYLDQFTAVLPTIYQFLFLLIILTYQRWYIDTELEKLQSISMSSLVASDGSHMSD